MEVAEFIFTKLDKSIKVYIPNLEKLDVSLIQKIESFVKKRDGIFNFSTYCFEMQRNLEFNEFEKLVNALTIECRCKEDIIYEESQPRLDFGQYKGMLLGDIEDSYLVWLKNNYRGHQKEFIVAELLRRGL